MSAYRNLTAEESFRRYWRGIRGYRAARYGLLAAYIYGMLAWRGSGALWNSPWWVFLWLASLAVFFLALRGLRLVSGHSFLKLEQILAEDCDAVKYTQVMALLRARQKRSRGMAAVYQAQGLSFCGKFREAADLLDETELKSNALAARLIWQSVRFGCCAHLGEEHRAEELRREAGRLLENKRLGRRLREANALVLTRMDQRLAFLHRDYETFRRLAAELEPQYTYPIQRVSHYYDLALADLAQGDRNSARTHLQFVAEQGGTTFYAAEARRQLAELAP